MKKIPPKYFHKSNTFSDILTVYLENKTKASAVANKHIKIHYINKLLPKAETIEASIQALKKRVPLCYKTQLLIKVYSTAKNPKQKAYFLNIVPLLKDKFYSSVVEQCEKHIDNDNDKGKKEANLLFNAFNYLTNQSLNLKDILTKRREEKR